MKMNMRHAEEATCYEFDSTFDQEIAKYHRGGQYGILNIFDLEEHEFGIFRRYVGGFVANEKEGFSTIYETEQGYGILRIKS
jgi:hypothetical protein